MPSSRAAAITLSSCLGQVGIGLGEAAHRRGLVPRPVIPTIWSAKPPKKSVKRKRLTVWISTRPRHSARRRSIAAWESSPASARVDVGAKGDGAVGPGRAQGELRAPVDILLGPPDAVVREDAERFPEVAVDARRPVPGVALVQVRVDLEETREDEDAAEVGQRRPCRPFRAPAERVPDGRDAVALHEHVAFAPRLERRGRGFGRPVKRGRKAGEGNAGPTEEVHVGIRPGVGGESVGAAAAKINDCAVGQRAPGDCGRGVESPRRPLPTDARGFPSAPDLNNGSAE